MMHGHGFFNQRRRKHLRASESAQRTQTTINQDATKSNSSRCSERGRGGGFRAKHCTSFWSSSRAMMRLPQ